MDIQTTFIWEAERLYSRFDKKFRVQGPVLIRTKKGFGVPYTVITITGERTFEAQCWPSYLSKTTTNLNNLVDRWIAIQTLEQHGIDGQMLLDLQVKEEGYD